MPAIRALSSALIIGASAWFAAGRLTVASADAAAERLAVPASLWWFLVPAVLALALPGLRKRPALAAPALLATLPWWPLPLPAAALIWTGPMAWVPIGLAVLLAVWAAPGAGGAGDERDIGLEQEAAVRAAEPGLAVATAVLAGVLTLILGVAVAASVDSRTPGGDEPHYLVITQSLLRDFDLRIENNHRDRDYAEYYGGTLAPDFIRRGANGEIYSIHAPGVSAVVAPAFALFGYRGAQATVLMTAAVTGALVWLIGWHATGRAASAWFAWAAVVVTSTFLLQAGMVFPDAPGALAVAGGVWLIVRLRRSSETLRPAQLVIAGALLAMLPWLHTRFAVLAAGLGLMLVWQIVAAATSRIAALAAFAAVPVASAAAWFAYFWFIYGTANPAAPYGDDPGARLAYVPGGLVAMLFDQQFGLLAYSPVLAAALFGLFTAGRFRLGDVTWAAAAVVLAYAAAVATYWMWWAGVPATPARFLTAAVPVAALPLAMTWSAAGRRGRLLLVVLLAASLATTVVTVSVGGGNLAWNTRNAEAQWLEWLGPVVNLPRAWPSFFWRLSPDDLSTELPFAVHVATFVAVICGGLAGAVWLSGRGANPVRGAAPALAWALPLSLMVAAEGGWRLNGVNGLDPARAQLALLRLVGEGQPAWRIAPRRAGPDADAARGLRVRSDEPGRTDAPPPWAVLTGVPPGDFSLRVAQARHAEPVAVTIGRSPRPVAEATTDGAGTLILPLSLPAGARALTVDGPGRAAGAGPAVELRVVRLRPPLDRLAQAYTRYGALDLLVLDGDPYLEERGFWVRGASTAEWLIVSRTMAGGRPMLLQNGGAPNQVTVTMGESEETFEMAPSETRRVEVPLEGMPGIAVVRVRSAAGFRPSEVGPSDDRRYLGVWVEIEGDGSPESSTGGDRSP
jgi:hypothetical protein